MIQANDIRIVSLEPFELTRAANLGVQRQIRNLFTLPKGSGVNSPEEGFESQILRACGELAVAKCLDVYWPGSLDPLSVPGLGTVEVRTTNCPGGSLSLLKEDADDKAFILVVGQDATCRIVGWIFGREGKVDRFWRTEDVRHPAYVLNPKRSKAENQLFRPISTLLGSSTER